MQPAWIQLYLEGLPNQDPVYRSIREAIYGKDRPWQRKEASPYTGPLTLVAGNQRWKGLPLASLETAYGWESRAWNGSQLLARPEQASELLHLLNRQPGWDVCQLHTLFQNETRALADACAEQGNFASFQPHPVTVVAGATSYADYVEQRAKAHGESNRAQKKSMRKAAELGIEYRSEPLWEEILTLLDKRDRAFSNGSDYTKTVKFREFFKAFREAIKAEGRALEIGVYTPGDQGRLIGYLFCFRTGSVYHFYQTCFDAEYAKLRPGLLAFEKAMERTLDLPGEKIVGFMGTADYFKRLAWQELPLAYMTVYSRSWKGRLVSAVRGLKEGRGKNAGYAV